MLRRVYEPGEDERKEGRGGGEEVRCSILRRKGGGKRCKVCCFEFVECPPPAGVGHAG